MSSSEKLSQKLVSLDVLNLSDAEIEVISGGDTPAQTDQNNILDLLSKTANQSYQQQVALMTENMLIRPVNGG
jgi:siroheme synthase